MARLTYKEAAHRLRMTIRLVKWCESFSPKGDRRKLQVDDSFIEESELSSFDSYLGAGWPSRRVPSGIKRELLLEAAGRCGVCEQPCEHFEEAHIERKGEELSYYCQHPHNLILLCGSCHGRYDRGSTITLDVVRKKKEVLLSRLMEDVDRDIALAQIVPEGVKELQRGLAANAGKPDQNSSQEWTTFITSLFATSGSIPNEMVTAPRAAELRAKLQQASTLLSNAMPVTSGTLLASAEGLEATGTFIPPTDAETWDFIEPESQVGVCLRCTMQTPVEGYECLACGHSGAELYGEVPSMVDREASPVRVYFEDARGDSEAVTCESCDSDELEFEFQSICDYCQHIADKDE